MTDKTQHVALVTGAAQGIGQRTALELSSNGHALVLTDKQSLSATETRLETTKTPFLSIVADVSNEAAIKAMAESVLDRFGRIDVVVNNAGVSYICPAEETTVEEWRQVMDINLLGPFLTCRAFWAAHVGAGVREHRERGLRGGAHGYFRPAAYNTSKHGLIGLTRTLAAEWGGRGVRVNAVCPGWVKTPMDDSAIEAGLYVDADIEGRVPMGRFASAEDVARAIAFLADPDRSGFINGHALSVDGGWFADGSWESLRRSKRIGTMAKRKQLDAVGAWRLATEVGR